ncbi:hypothetical protein H6G04_22880 [Calothrix membranacea FACHB-236]|nr:hypothetical protein [Calothrix membranacea FACHB-236]
MVSMIQGHYLPEANQPINLIIKQTNAIEKKLKGDIFEVATVIHEAVRNIILDTRTNPDLTVEFKSLIALINSSLSLGIKNTL